MVYLSFSSQFLYQKNILVQFILMSFKANELTKKLQSQNYSTFALTQHNYFNDNLNSKYIQCFAEDLASSKNYAIALKILFYTS